MKWLISSAFLFVTCTTIGQENVPKAGSVDTLNKKIEALQKQLNAQQEELTDLKHENRLLHKEVSKNHGFKRGFGNRQRVVVDRRGSKQAYVVYY